MADFLQRLRERKLVQWALAYGVAAFALIQVTDVVAQQFGWPDSVRRGVTIALTVGFLVTLVLAWYHGERGAQRVSGTELLMLALILAVGGGLLWRFALRSAGMPVAALNDTAGTAAADRKSIAVLPFANLSSDKDSNYFSDGVRDMILTKLATIGDLKVISRTSTDKYGNRPEDLKTVALQLGVANVLEGSVQKSGNQVLINLQLISAGNDQHLWAEAYKRSLDDIFGVEGEVAETVAAALNAKLSDVEQKSIAERPTADAEAFDLFLRAEHVRYEAEKVQSQPNHSGLVEAVALYEKAVAKDPRFALAWAEMAFSRAILYWYGDAESANLQETARLARQNAERALALQPASSEANLAMGFYHYYVQVDLAQALVSFETALRAKPNDATVLYALGLITRRLDRFDEAIDHLGAANRLDPHNQVVSAALLSTLMQARRYSRAAQLCDRLLALDPADEKAQVTGALTRMVRDDDVAGAMAYLRGTTPGLQLVRAELLRRQKKSAEAIALVEAVPDTEENFSQDQRDTILGSLYLEAGRADAARPLLLDARQKLAAENAQVPDDHPRAAEARLALAYVDAQLGDAQAAVALAQKALSLPATLPEKNYLGWLRAAARAARVFAQARRADLAVPLLERLVKAPGAGIYAAYSELRLDPDFEPIRSDPAFQALVQSHPGSGEVAE